MNNTALALQSSVYDDGSPDLTDYNPRKAVSDGSINPKEYIRAVKKDLTENGETSSSSELQNMRDELMSSYKTIRDSHKRAMADLRAMKKEIDAEKKSGLDSELMTAKYDKLTEKEIRLKTEYASSRSDYMSALGKIARQKYQAEMTEGKTLDEVLDYKEPTQGEESDNNRVDAYHKMILARRWFLNTPQIEHHADEGSGKLSSEYGIERMQRAHYRIDALMSSIEEKRNPTRGEQNAYARVTEQIGTLQDKFRESYELEQQMVRNANVIPFPKQNKEPEITTTAEGKGIGNWLRRHVGGIVVGCILVISVACASLYNSQAASSKPLASPTPYASVTQTAPIFTPPPLPLHSSIPKPTPIFIPAKPAPKVLQPGEYEIKPNDTLEKIGIRFYDDAYAYLDLARINDIKDHDNIKAGDVIRLKEFKEQGIKTAGNERTAATDGRIAMNDIEDLFRAN